MKYSVSCWLFVATIAMFLSGHVLAKNNEIETARRTTCEAIWKGRIAQVKKLLKYDGRVDPDDQEACWSSHGRISYLETASQACKPAIVDLLVRLHATLGQTYMAGLRAIGYGPTTGVDQTQCSIAALKILDAGADPNLLYETRFIANQFMVPTIFFASHCQKGAPEALSVLLKYNVNINAQYKGPIYGNIVSGDNVLQSLLVPNSAGEACRQMLDLLLSRVDTRAFQFPNDQGMSAYQKLARVCPTRDANYRRGVEYRNTIIPEVQARMRELSLIPASHWSTALYFRLTATKLPSMRTSTHSDCSSEPALIS